jgi:hypothetical protein
MPPGDRELPLASPPLGEGLWPPSPRLTIPGPERLWLGRLPVCPVRLMLGRGPSARRVSSVRPALGLTTRGRTDTTTRRRFPPPLLASSGGARGLRTLSPVHRTPSEEPPTYLVVTARCRAYPHPATLAACKACTRVSPSSVGTGNRGD